MRTLFFTFIVNALLVAGFGTWSSFSAELPRDGAAKKSLVKMTNMTEEALAKLVNTNMSRQDIVARFGEPDSLLDPQDGIDRWDFVFTDTPDPGPRRWVATGLTISWRGEKMIRWAPAYGTTGGKPQSEFMKPIQPKSANGHPAITNQSISFWVVSKERIEGGRYIDSTQLPKLGWIAKEPSLKVLRVKSATAGHEPVNYDGESPREEYQFGIALLPDDAESFRQLTEQNRGKQILFMVGEHPVMAPRVYAPIVGGRFTVTVPNEKDFKDLHDLLRSVIVTAP